MEPIKNDNEKNTVAQATERFGRTQKKVFRSIFNNMAMIIGIFIIIVVIIVFTTDVKVSGSLHWTEIGITVFILIFCSYSMYVNFVGSGTRAGKQQKTYTDTLTSYEELKKQIVDNKHQNRIGEFCRYYVKEELKNTRTSILTEVGISFETYSKEYIGKDESALKNNSKLSKSQIEAIIKANKTKPVKLAPEMILKRGRGNSRRSPLGIKPETRKSIAYSAKFVYTTITSLLTGIILFDVIIDPTWATLAACCLKVLLVVLNGFWGYKMGYENITIHTVEYMSDQIDLMSQLEQYVETHPEPKDEIITTEPQNEPIEEEKVISKDELPEPTEQPADETIEVPTESLS